MSATIGNMGLGDSAFDGTAALPFQPGSGPPGLKVTAPTLATKLLAQILSGFPNGSLLYKGPNGSLLALPDVIWDSLGNVTFGPGSPNVSINGTLAVGGRIRSTTGFLTLADGQALKMPSGSLVLPLAIDGLQMTGIPGPFTLPFPCDGYFQPFELGTGQQCYIPYFLTQPS